MIFNVYDLDYFLIAQFENYQDLSKYMGVSEKCLQCYFTKQKKVSDKRIKNKYTKKIRIHKKR